MLSHQSNSISRIVHASAPTSISQYNEQIQMLDKKLAENKIRELWQEVREQISQAQSNTSNNVSSSPAQNALATAPTTAYSSLQQPLQSNTGKITNLTINVELYLNVLLFTARCILTVLEDRSSSFETWASYLRWFLLASRGCGTTESIRFLYRALSTMHAVAYYHVNPRDIWQEYVSHEKARKASNASRRKSSSASDKASVVEEDKNNAERAANATHVRAANATPTLAEFDELISAPRQSWVCADHRPQLEESGAQSPGELNDNAANGEASVNFHPEHTSVTVTTTTTITNNNSNVLSEFTTLTPALSSTSYVFQQAPQTSTTHEEKAQNVLVQQTDRGHESKQEQEQQSEQERQKSTISLFPSTSSAMTSASVFPQNVCNAQSYMKSTRDALPSRHTSLQGECLTNGATLSPSPSTSAWTSSSFFTSSSSLPLTITAAGAATVAGRSLSLTSMDKQSIVNKLREVVRCLPKLITIVHDNMILHLLLTNPFPVPRFEFVQGGYMCDICMRAGLLVGYQAIPADTPESDNEGEELSESSESSEDDKEEEERRGHQEQSKEEEEEEEQRDEESWVNSKRRNKPVGKSCRSSSHDIRSTANKNNSVNISRSRERINTNERESMQCNATVQEHLHRKADSGNCICASEAERIASHHKGHHSSSHKRSKHQIDNKSGTTKKELSKADTRNNVCLARSRNYGYDVCINCAVKLYLEQQRKLSLALLPQQHQQQQQFTSVINNSGISAVNSASASREAQTGVRLLFANYVQEVRTTLVDKCSVLNPWLEKFYNINSNVVNDDDCNENNNKIIVNKLTEDCNKMREEVSCTLNNDIALRNNNRAAMTNTNYVESKIECSNNKRATNAIADKSAFANKCHGNDHSCAHTNIVYNNNNKANNDNINCRTCVLAKAQPNDDVDNDLSLFQRQHCLQYQPFTNHQDENVNNVERLEHQKLPRPPRRAPSQMRWVTWNKKQGNVNATHKHYSVILLPDHKHHQHQHHHHQHYHYSREFEKGEIESAKVNNDNNINIDEIKNDVNCKSKLVDTVNVIEETECTNTNLIMNGATTTTTTTNTNEETASFECAKHVDCANEGDDDDDDDDNNSKITELTPSLKKKKEELEEEKEEMVNEPCASTQTGLLNSLNSTTISYSSSTEASLIVPPSSRCTEQKVGHVFIEVAIAPFAGWPIAWVIPPSNAIEPHLRLRESSEQNKISQYSTEQNINDRTNNISGIRPNRLNMLLPPKGCEKYLHIVPQPHPSWSTNPFTSSEKLQSSTQSSSSRSETMITEVEANGLVIEKQLEAVSGCNHDTCANPVRVNRSSITSVEPCNEEDQNNAAIKKAEKTTCCSGCLSSKTKTVKTSPRPELEEIVCPICLYPFTPNGQPALQTRCNHFFHVECILQHVKTSRDVCPLCRADNALPNISSSVALRENVYEITLTLSDEQLSSTKPLRVAVGVLLSHDHIFHNLTNLSAVTCFDISPHEKTYFGKNTA